MYPAGAMSRVLVCDLRVEKKKMVTSERRLRMVAPASHARGCRRRKEAASAVELLLFTQLFTRPATWAYLRFFTADFFR